MIEVPPIDMREEWLAGLRAWAEANGNVLEFWLFGSRATGRSRPDSDVDLALVLMPARGNHDWAMGNYVAESSLWRSELEAIVGRHVSIEAVTPEAEEVAVLRRVLLWARG
jgi:predicted nucleotidyltransferase